MESTPMDLPRMRATALRAFEIGVAAAAPDDAVREALGRKPGSHSAPIIIAVGKAAGRMMQAALEVYPAPKSALVVTNPENAQPIAGATVMAAAHPVPDQAGLEAGAEVLKRLSQAEAGDEVLALISGGGSALLPAPVQGVTLADKAAVSAALLGSGADIQDMNLVRQNLSRLKGGGFLQAAQPAHVRALILSDVVGDDLRVIASGPTVSPLGSQSEARKILQDRGLWKEMPASVRAHLTGSAPARPHLDAENELIGSNAISRAAMAKAFPQAHVMTQDLDGDVRVAAETLAEWADGAGMWICGGETTVQLKGTGVGGRNQELALHLARAAQRRGWERPWVYLQGGTDGRDGPCDAAGAIVDHTTLQRIAAKGGDIKRLLDNNDSYAALGMADDLLMTGGTGTNVADLGILIRG